MTPSVKKSRKPVAKHVCTSEDTIKRQGILIERIGKVTLGNGTPEDGLLFQFREFLKDHKKVVDDISEMKDSISKALEDAATTRHAFELYKTYENGGDERMKEKEERDNIAKNLSDKENNDKWQKVIWTIMAIIGIGGIVANIIISISK